MRRCASSPIDMDVSEFRHSAQRQHWTLRATPTALYHTHPSRVAALPVESFFRALLRILRRVPQCCMQSTTLCEHSSDSRSCLLSPVPMLTLCVVMTPQLICARPVAWSSRVRTPPSLSLLSRVRNASVCLSLPRASFFLRHRAVGQQSAKHNNNVTQLSGFEQRGNSSSISAQ